MNIKTGKRVSVSVSQETKGLLDSIKHRGQSYDGLLHELAARWQRAKEEEVKRGNPGTEAIKGNPGTMIKGLDNDNMNKRNQAD